MNPISEIITGWTDVVVAFGGAVFFIIMIPILFSILSRMKRIEEQIFVKNFLILVKWPLAIFVAFLLVYLSSFDKMLGNEVLTKDVIVVLLIISSTWFFLRLVKTIKMVIHQKFPLDKADNLNERKIRTQYQYIHALLSIIVVIIGISMIFFQFEKLRVVGAGLLASAGIATLVLAFTAQQTLSNLIAGFQIAFTQPFRIDDVVIVEGEWGKIEEITLTYVVVRIWDQRRLVIPISYFITTPFQNWTRTTADIWGTVTINVDYMVPVDRVREELERIVKQTKEWDGNVVGLQVTDSSERTMTLRALVSAKDASDAWDLRCHVRERLIGYLQKEYPGSLPRIRIEDVMHDDTDGS
ncbi:MAG: mechanosensitive ion channel [Thermoplasmatota archaeon]